VHLFVIVVNTMNLTRLFSSLALVALLLAGCSPQESATGTASSSSSAKREVSLATVAAQAKGFTAGPLMAANPVYVFFDPQCPHCGRLWEASLPLQKKIKFVWIPVGIINPSSSAQGAALLSAANPVERMSEHEASLLAGTGGISASASISADMEQAIKANTQLLNSMGAESVPFIVAQNPANGQTVSREGSMSTAALAEFLGTTVP
jgi:thiol:disulfide interchange protein DsbG